MPETVEETPEGLVGLALLHHFVESLHPTEFSFGLVLSFILEQVSSLAWNSLGRLG